MYAARFDENVHFYVSLEAVSRFKQLYLISNFLSGTPGGLRTGLPRSSGADLFPQTLEHRPSCCFQQMAQGRLCDKSVQEGRQDGAIGVALILSALDHLNAVCYVYVCARVCAHDVISESFFHNFQGMGICVSVCVCVFISSI